MIQAWGQSSNSVPLPMALAANNTWAANPNAFGVYVKVSGATVTNIAINDGANLGVTSGTFLITRVPPTG